MFSSVDSSLASESTESGTTTVGSPPTLKVQPDKIAPEAIKTPVRRSFLNKCIKSP
ncbi:hypothetical protein CZ765_11410 [Corynebacterium casei]|nr:hypothetical protein CZ765_11410 [Corynebacterium casei]